VRRGSRLGALEEPQFRLLFLGQAATAIGDRMSMLALAFGVLAISNSATALGLVLACGTISTVVFLLAGGVYADRLSRRNVMVGADLVRWASQGVAASLLIAGQAEVWHLAVVQTVNGAAAAFFIPAQQGLIPEAVSAPRLQQANALLSMSRNATGLAGPALAGLLVTTVGAGWAIGVDALTFLASAVLLSRLRVPQSDRARTPFLAELRGGWREFSSRTWVWASVVNFALFQLVVLSSWLVLGPYVSNTELGGAGAWAAILVAGSIGALAGGAAALRRRPERVGVVMFAAVAFYAPQLALLGFAAPLWAIALATAAGYAGMSVSNALWFTALQERIPAGARSRVSSYDWLGSMIFLPIGMAVIGPVSEAIGVTATLLIAAAWAAGGSLFMTLLPSIRALRREDTAAPVPTHAVATAS
jgi:MFS family permease